jgi:hypothetical protein
VVTITGVKADGSTRPHGLEVDTSGLLNICRISTTEGWFSIIVCPRLKIEYLIFVTIDGYCSVRPAEYGFESDTPDLNDGVIQITL